MTVRVGLCGFSMAMGNYALHFPVVEIQQTFYEPPADAVLRRWRARTGSALEYTMKVWQRVTHPAISPTYRRVRVPPTPDAGFFRATSLVHDAWRRSLECAEVLAATALLFQCPASFGPTAENVAAMRRFFTQVARPAARLLWEPRGAAWIAERPLALALCAELDVTHVVDPFVTPPASGVAAYWRLHGIGGARHAYTDDELRHLRDQVLQVESEGPAYVMFNNLPRVDDARRFAALVAT